MFSTVTAGPKPVVEAARPALEAIWARLAPHLNGAYANFLASATEEDVAAIYPAQTYRRLAAVKRQYDPGNLFAHNHNVRPSSSRLDGASDSRSANRETGSPVPLAPRPDTHASSATRTAHGPKRAAS